MNGPLAPDDDPRFNAWVRDVGPMQDMPPADDIHTGRPVVAAIAVLAAIAGIAAALGWAAFAYAVGFGVTSHAALVLLILGTSLVALGAAGALLSARRWPQ